MNNLKFNSRWFTLDFKIAFFFPAN
ncbi:tryptophanase leader peptide [Photobacterium nomapromontoriensis]